MAALTQGASLKMQVNEKSSYDLPANQQVWRGAALEIPANSLAVPLTSGANKNFGGFALDDQKGGASDRDQEVEVATKGILTTAVTGATPSSVNELVYASTDNTDDFDTSSASNRVKVGVIIQHVSGATNATVKIRFDAFAKQLAA